MNTKIKYLLPPLVFLMLGMLFFSIVRSIPLSFNTAIDHKLIMGTISCFFLYGLSQLFVKFDNSSLVEMNLMPTKSTISKLIIGLIIGGVILGIMLLALFYLTNLGIQRVENQPINAFLIATLAFIPLALMEEILFRGYPFFRLTQLINIRWVVLITAVLFALYHYNSSSSVINLLIGPGIWGVVYAVAAYLSNSIAVPLGIHISANFFQAVFGLKRDYPSLWEVVESSNLAIIDNNSLGLILQFALLFVSIIILELFIKRKKSIQLKVTKLQSKANSHNNQEDL